MDAITRQPRLLVKLRGAPAEAELTLAGNRSTKAAFEPLFRSIRPGASTAIAAPGQWFLMSTCAKGDEVNAWDLCHQLTTQGFGVAGITPAEFAEPDFDQHWLTGQESDLALAMARTCDKP